MVVQCQRPLDEICLLTLVNENRFRKPPNVNLESIVVHAYSPVDVFGISRGEKDQLQAGGSHTPTVAGDGLGHADCPDLLGFAGNLFALSEVLGNAAAKVRHH